MGSTVVDSLILDLLEWVNARERTYAEVMDAWRTSCPSWPVWEEASERGLILVDGTAVRATALGTELLRMMKRPPN